MSERRDSNGFFDVQRACSRYFPLSYAARLALGVAFVAGLTVACSTSDEPSAGVDAAVGGAIQGVAGGGLAGMTTGIAGLAGSSVSGATQGGGSSGGSGGALASGGGLPNGGTADAGGVGGGGGASGMGGAASGSSCSPGMVRISSKDKSFMMGLDSNEAPLQSNGQPWACYLGKHQVTFTYDYCVDAKLVTQGEFAALMGFNPAKHKTADLTLPVDAETWYDAVLYCNKKSLKDGLELAYSYGAVTLTGMSASNIAGVTLDLKKNGYRLPTNAEYEYAERGDATGLYFFSPTQTANITDLGAAYAWYSVNSKGVSQPVGLLKPNPWGLYDIVGNLFEWENDWEGPYETTSEVDPTGPDMGTSCGGYDVGIQKMAKGGSWHTDVATHMRIGYHYKWKPASVHAELGFRCVATVN
jgi:formylglycine-generating enzyme required for sulfatase activity